MQKPLKLISYSLLEDRKPVYAEHNGLDLVLIRYDHKLSVLYGRCLHRGALLSDGHIEGDNLICGVHGWDYRYDTGVSEYNNEEALHKFSSTIDIPLFVSDMSFGALSKEAKISLAKGAELAGTGIASGEGGMLPEEQAANSRYLYEMATIQVDFDPLALSKFHKIDVPVWGEISLTLSLMMEALKNQTKTRDQRPELVKRWKIWHDEKTKRLKEERGKGISSIAIFDSLSRLAPEDAVVCVDVGNNAYSLGRYFESKKHSFLMSGYLGSIGFAYPAALGAWSATRGSRPVIAVAGDGGFAQYMAELTTSVKYDMDIKLILLNNSELGKISKEQRAGGYNVFATDMHNPDFAAYANACGALGIKVDKKADLEAAMQKILNHRGTGLLEIITDVGLI